MGLPYNYEFDGDDCWYKAMCTRHDTSYCNASCFTFMRMHYMITQSTLTPELRHAPIFEPDKLDRKSYEYLKEIKKDVKGFLQQRRPLVLRSDTHGNGKTTWAARLLLAYIGEVKNIGECSVRALYVDIKRYIDALKNNTRDDRQYVEHISEFAYNIPLLVIDGINPSLPWTPQAANWFMAVSESRNAAGLTTIFTITGKDDEINSTLDSYAIPTITNKATVVNFRGKDHRQTFDLVGFDAGEDA